MFKQYTTKVVPGLLLVVHANCAFYISFSSFKKSFSVTLTIVAADTVVPASLLMGIKLLESSERTLLNRQVAYS